MNRLALIELFWKTIYELYDNKIKTLDDISKNIISLISYITRPHLNNNLVLFKYELFEWSQQKFNRKIKKISENLFLLLNKIDYYPICEICKINEVRFKNFNLGYSKTCSSRCSYFHCKDKIKQTCLEKYGVEYIFQNKEVQEKQKNTLMKKYGVIHNSKIPGVKDKYKQTCLERYGVDNSLKCKKIQEKIKKTFLNKYGVDNPMKSKCVQDKMKKTNLEKYGFECASKSEIVQDKIKQTNLEKYGTTSAFKNEDIKKKIKQTNLKRYGVGYNLQREEVRDKIKQTNLEKYGTEYGCQSEEVKEKIRKTNLEKYGVENVSQNKEIQERRKKTVMDKYGVSHFSKSEQFKNSMMKTSYDRLINSERLKNKCIPNFTANEYNGIKSYFYYYSWICKQCNNKFKDHLMDGHIPKCPKCYPINTSENEIELFNLCKSILNLSVEKGNRSVLKGREIDIYIPELKLGIEFNGLYWHSEIGGNKLQKYHLNKTLNSKEKNVQLIHIFEDEWNNQQEIVKSILLSKMRKIDNIIYARKCIIKKIDKEIALTFLFDNHLQGPINGKHFGLYYQDKLVALLTMGKPRFNKNYEWEILRYCNKLNSTVIGGFSRLLTYFKKTYNPSSIITYADARYSNGNLYNKNNFKFIGLSKPNYYYMKHYKYRESRIKYQKHKLPNLLENFDPNLTEWENMQLNGYDRIWDCGNYVYEWRKNNCNLKI